MAKQILDENQDLTAINKVHYLLATTYDRQHQAGTSKRLASNPKACVSNVCKEITTARLDPKDNHSRTGSSERRREGDRNWKGKKLDGSHPSLLWQPQQQGEDPNVQRTSTAMTHHHLAAPICHLPGKVDTPETPGLMVQVESTYVITLSRGVSRHSGRNEQAKRINTS
jgi:hypothetical protein